MDMLNVKRVKKYLNYVTEFRLFVPMATAKASLAERTPARTAPSMCPGGRRAKRAAGRMGEIV